MKNKHIKRFNESDENLNISDVSDSLSHLEKYVEDRIMELGTLLDIFPDAPNNDLLLGRLQEAKVIRIQIWRLGKLKNVK